MQTLSLRSAKNASLALGLLVTLAACAGSGTPTPPGMIGEAPKSITESLPPAEADTLPTAANAEIPPLGGTNALPPASSIGTAPAQQNTANQVYKAPASNTVLTFEPMVGAPKRVARELSRSLGMRVAQQALPVVARSDNKITHRVKGYFSAHASGQNCVVSYIWDIFDKNGKRINRVSGSKQTPMVSSDPWDSVQGPILDQVAVDTAAQLKSWHASL